METSGREAGDPCVHLRPPHRTATGVDPAAPPPQINGGAQLAGRRRLPEQLERGIGGRAAGLVAVDRHHEARLGPGQLPTVGAEIPDTLDEVRDALLQRGLADRQAT
ncbi:hypothetical protein [Dactylosporangium sp. NPDC000521]|uniref:hypothetical protein n=1 Tax=Dactylosporangium sp. NPDC000521 TaxID=3363975 RepID=UPI003690EF57